MDTVKEPRVDNIQVKYENLIKNRDLFIKAAYRPSRLIYSGVLKAYNA